MKKRNDLNPAETKPATPSKDLTPDPVEEAQPIDKVKDKAIQPTDPPVPTAQDDDEGGADPIDPDTGQPYDNKDSGTVIPAAGRKGGTDES